MNFLHRISYLLFIFGLIIIFSCKKEVKHEGLIDTPQVNTQKEIFQTGVATWYGPGFDGKKTTSGQLFDMYAFTAAHRTLPFGAIIRVRNTKNNRYVLVRINDRGPVNTKLILDLSKIAANNIDIGRKGSGKVEIEILSVSENPLKKIFEVYWNIGNEE